MYFNRRSEYPWSVDDGEQAHEINVKGVEGFGHWRTQYSGEAPNEATPVAWLEVQANGYAILNERLVFL